jgi:hypothetical protein
MPPVGRGAEDATWMGPPRFPAMRNLRSMSRPCLGPAIPDRMTVAGGVQMTCVSRTFPHVVSPPGSCRHRSSTWHPGPAHQLLWQATEDDVLDEVTVAYGGAVLFGRDRNVV